MTNICRVCASNRNQSYSAREMMYGTRESFEYFQCDDCHCLQIETIPDNIGDYYPGSYYSHGLYDGKKFTGLRGKINKFIFAFSISNRGIVQRILESLINPVKHSALLSRLRVTRDSRIMDVGCGNGKTFLYPLAEIGFKNLLGCDPYLAEDIEYSNGLKIISNELFSIGGKWDYIFYHHSFEHLASPLEHLHEIRTLLDTGGLCILRIPTSSSYAWETYRTDWYQLDAPRHFYLHSIESMEILADQSGFAVDEVIFDSTYHQILISEAYRNDISMKQKIKRSAAQFMRRQLDKIKYRKLSALLNASGKGDQAIFILRALR